MTKGQRTITALLGAVCVLLAMNLMTSGVTATPAPQEEGPTGACCVLGSCFNGQTPAECAAVGGTFIGLGTLCGQPNSVCTPPPTVVSVTVAKDAATSYALSG